MSSSPEMTEVAHDGSILAAVELVEAHASLALFAEGIAGEPVRIETLEGAGQGWPWTAPVDDPLVVRLPAVMDIFSTSAANRVAYRTQVLQQLNHRFLATAANNRREGHPLIESAADPSLTRELFALFENWRVATATTRQYPGAATGLDQAMASALDSSLDGRPTPILAVRVATLGLPAASVMAGVEVIDGWAVRLADPSATTDLSASAALAVVELIEQLARELEGDPDQANEPPRAELAMDEVSIDDEEPDENEEMGPPEGAAFGSTLPPVEAMLVDELDGAVIDGDLPLAESAKDEAQKNVRGPKPQRRSWAIEDIDTDGRSFLYDEWDYLAERYRAAWCRVVEERLVGDDHEFIAEVRRSHQDLRARIRRSFAQLRPQERLRMHKRLDGDDLDLDAVVAALVDRRSGRMPDENLHIRREPMARDVATAILVDLSSSTGSLIVEPEPVPLNEWGEIESDFVQYPSRGVGQHDVVVPVVDSRKVIDVAKEAVALMCDALGQLGDRHAVYGFSGTGRKNVQFVVAKQFDDRTSPSTWSALAGMKPMAYTRMGPAIRHAAAQLAVQESQTKILLVISDGYPQDIDYGDDRRDRSYGIEDTARALEEARAAGIAPFCVTIDPAGHDYLRTMCPDERYLVIDDVAALPDELAKLYLTLTKPSVTNW